ncbi:MAG TPA: MFS transporter, partial [Anaerolineaceae bacterium]|nr:MFS transporter [Anaerolineaceae bacterium]
MKRVIRFIKIYGENIAAFQPNARLYLLNVVLSGAASGVFRLLFNFFVLSLGYDKDFLGNMVGVSSLTALIAALPMGYVVDWLGRKRSLLISSLLVSVSTLTMILLPSQGILLGMNILMGLAQSLSGVTFGPFLMENSSDKERTYLFSFSSGISMAAGFVGNWVGGYMPTWMGSWRGYEAISAQAYALALVVVVGVMATAAVPLFFIRKPNLSASQRTSFMPLSYLKNQAGLFSRLILPMLLTSFGAGLIMPFMNVFFRET